MLQKKHITILLNILKAILQMAFPIFWPVEPGKPANHKKQPLVYSTP